MINATEKRPQNERMMSVPQTVSKQELLISLRDLSELETLKGARIKTPTYIDFKEPNLGSLGATKPEIWHQVARWRDSPANAECLSGVSLSVALGSFSTALSNIDSLPDCFDFAKFGPEGVGGGVQGIRRLAEAWDACRAILIERSTDLVAVAYADHQKAACPPVRQVVEAAIRSGVERVLIDTFTKCGRTCLDFISLEELRLIQDDLPNGWWALAGGLKVSDIEYIRTEGIHPSCLAFRGAVCSRGRTSSFDALRYGDLLSVFSRTSWT
ncbi:MAG: (5-formylfuran-3-yl)methyl phosphate synthase [Planctomycetota bacterium]